MAGHLRSVSLPSQSHSVEVICDEELNKLRACMASSVATAQMMCDALSGVGNSYEHIEEALQLPTNQNALSRPCHKESVEAELEASVKLLDLCSAVRDNLAAMNKHVLDVQSALRRGDDAAIESKVQVFVRLSRKASKDIKKQIRNKCGALPESKLDRDKSDAIRLLTEAREITVSLLETVLSFLSTRMVKPKTSNWSLVRRALYNRKVVCEEEREEDDLFLPSFRIKDNEEKRAKTRYQLQTLETTIEGLERGLECVFKRLIRSRVSLLNILSS